MSATTNMEVDVTGLNCPLPVLRTKKALHDLAVGQTLKVIATDTGSMEDIPSFVRQAGHELLEKAEESPGRFVFLIRKT